MSRKSQLMRSDLSRAGLKKHHTNSIEINSVHVSWTDTLPFPPILTNGRDHGEVQEPPPPLRGPREQQPFPLTPPRTQCTGQQNAMEQPNPKDQQQQTTPSNSSPRQRCQPAPRPPPSANDIPEQVGHNMYNSLKILGLGLGATERGVKLAYCRLARIYHPEKQEQIHHNTGKWHLWNSTMPSHSYDSTFNNACQLFHQKRYTFLLLVFYSIFLAQFWETSNMITHSLLPWFKPSPTNFSTPSQLPFAFSVLTTNHQCHHA